MDLCHPRINTDGVPGSWPWLGPSLNVVAMCGVNRQVADLPSSLSAFQKRKREKKEEKENEGREGRKAKEEKDYKTARYLNK